MFPNDIKIAYFLYPKQVANNLRKNINIMKIFYRQHLRFLLTYLCHWDIFHKPCISSQNSKILEIILCTVKTLYTKVFCFIFLWSLKIFSTLYNYIKLLPTSKFKTKIIQAVLLSYSFPLSCCQVTITSSFYFACLLFFQFKDTLLYM